MVCQIINFCVFSFLQQLHEEKGVKFHFQAGIKEFIGSGGKVTEAVLSTGATIPADVAVLGVGRESFT